MSVLESQAPPLTAGAKMTLDEFLQVWELHPEIKRAELLGGIVYMPSLVAADHVFAEDDLGGWLFTYRVATPGTDSGSNATAVMGDECPQPDRHLRILQACGGKSWIEEKYLHGAPELMAEVCASSKTYDLHQKYEVYEAAGVQEYVTVLVYEQEVRWHVLADGRYQRMPPDADGVLRSRSFPGLWLDPQALLNRDIPTLLATLQHGLASPEHRQFIEQLARQRAQS
jgi:hypothetical protein